MASIAIFSLYIVLLTLAHFSIQDIFSFAAVAPFIFRDAMKMFAFSLGFLWEDGGCNWSRGVGGPCGWGGRW